MTKTHRHNAHDRVGLGIELDRPADHLRVSAKPALPDIIPKHDHPGRALALIVREKRPAKPRRNPEQSEEVRGHLRASHAFRLLIRDRQITRDIFDRRQRLKAARLFLVGAKLAAGVLGLNCIIGRLLLA